MAGFFKTYISHIDVVIDRAVLAAHLLIDENSKSTGLLVPLFLVLSLRPYGYLFLDIFIHWSSSSSIFFSCTIGHTVPLT